MVKSVYLQLLWRVLKDVELVLHRARLVAFNDKGALTGGLTSRPGELAMTSVSKLVSGNVRLPTADGLVVIRVQRLICQKA